MKRILTSATLAAVGLALASPAAAANDNGPPPGLEVDDVLVCDGVETEVRAGEGRSGWLDGEKWALVTILATYEGVTVYEKSYGVGPAGDTMDCTGGSGPFELFVTVVRVQ